MRWDQMPLGQLYAVPSRNGVYKPPEYRGEGHKMVNMGELFKYDVISDQAMDRIRLSDRELEAFQLHEGDLLFGRRSLVDAGAGKCSLVRNPTEPTVFESSIIRVRLDRRLAVPTFYFYYFLSPIGRGRIYSLVTGTNVKGIRGSELQYLVVDYPPLPTQRRIATILSAYDDLIENNRRRIQLLEQAARLLHQEWFVRLRFPGHEHAQVVDGVPEGWERTRLDRVALVNQEQLKSTHRGAIEYLDISSVSPGSIDATQSFEFELAPGRARRVVHHGDIIWSCVRPNRRSHAIIWNPPPNMIVSTGFAVITPRQLPTSYLYYTLTTDSFVGYLTNRAHGGAYPAVLAADFEDAELLKPSEALLNGFDRLVRPMVNQRANLRAQNERLRQARDLLLPKIMSGDIEV